MRFPTADEAEKAPMSKQEKKYWKEQKKPRKKCIACGSSNTDMVKTQRKCWDCGFQS